MDPRKTFERLREAHSALNEVKRKSPSSMRLMRGVKHRTYREEVPTDIYYLSTGIKVFF